MHGKTIYHEITLFKDMFVSIMISDKGLIVPFCSTIFQGPKFFNDEIYHMKSR